MTRHRFHELDLLRGLACAMVVAYHFLWRGQAARWLSEDAPGWLAGPARFGYMGVYLFFIISGFVIFMSADGTRPRAFVASRVGRLYPALWVAAPLTALVALLTGREHFAVTPAQLAGNLTMVPQWLGVKYVDGAYWSLAVELQFYLLVWLALVTGRLLRPERLLAAWLVLGTLDAVRPMYTLERWLDVNWAPFFAIGICCYLLRVRGVTRTRLALLAWSATLAWYWVALNPLRYPMGPGSFAAREAVVATALLVAFVGVFVLIAFDHWRLARSPLTVWAGALTYPVYLLHQYAGYMLIEARSWHALPFGLRVAATVAAVLLLAAAVHRLVERPLGGWLRRLVGRPVPALRPTPT